VHFRVRFDELFDLPTLRENLILQLIQFVFGSGKRRALGNLLQINALARANIGKTATGGIRVALAHRVNGRL
jgi:hypothetical protein